MSKSLQLQRSGGGVVQGRRPSHPWAAITVAFGATKSSASDRHYLCPGILGLVRAPRLAILHIPPRLHPGGAPCNLLPHTIHTLGRGGGTWWSRSSKVPLPVLLYGCTQLLRQQGIRLTSVTAELSHARVPYNLDNVAGCVPVVLRFPLL